MDIRPALIDDLSDLHILQEQLNLYRGASYIPETIEFHKRTSEYSLYTKNDIQHTGIFIARIEGVLVGYIAGSIFERPQHVLKIGVSIDELFVLEDYRKQGVAQALVNVLEEYAKKHGCTFMTVHTDYENMLSQSFYQSSGMQKVTVELYKKIKD